MDESEEDKISRVERGGERISKPLSTTGYRLANLELLRGASSQQHIYRNKSNQHARHRNFYSDLRQIRPHLNHFGENIVFNISMPEPRKTKGYFMEESLSVVQSEKKKPSISIVQAVQPEIQLPVNPMTAACLAPVMQFIIEALNKTTTSEYLGSLPRHLDRATRLSLERPQPDDLNKKLSQLRYQEFKSKYTLSASGSLAIQSYLDNCSKKEALVIGELILEDVEFLLTSKYGHCIIRSLIGVHIELTNRAANLCIIKFETMATNEFASRIMQKLVEHVNSFRLFSLKKFSIDNSLWLDSIPGLFVLAACMRHSHYSEYRFVTDLLFKDKSKLLSSKVMKRVLVSVVEASGDEELQYIFGYLNIQRKFKRYLEDKSMTYVLIAFMRSNFMPAVRLLANQIASNLKELISKSYFKLLANKLISVGSQHVLTAINESLIALDSVTLFNLCDGGRTLPYLYYYVFLAFSSFMTETLEGTKKLLNFAYELANRLCTNPMMQKLDAQLSALLKWCLKL